MKDLDVSYCSICGEEVVGTLSELIELPLCNRLKCFAIAFPDDYKELMEEIEKKRGGNK